MQKEKQKLFSVPLMVKNARKDGKGYNIVLEALIFLLVFIVTSLSELVILGPAIIKYVLNIIDFSTLSSNPFAAYSTALEAVNTMPSWLILLQIFAKLTPMILLIIYCRKIEKRKLSTAGITKKKIMPEYLRGLIIGFILFGSSLLLAVITGATEFKGVSFSLSALPMLLLFLIAFIIQGAEEEIMCRGYFMVSVSRKSPVIAGVLANSVVFGLIHLGNPGFDLIPLINIILFGLFMSVYFIRRGNLWGACAVHSIWNYSQGNIFGLQVSGMNGLDSFLDFDVKEGKDLLSGGSFGPEGGLCVTIVLVAAILLAVFFMKNKDLGQTEE